MRWHFPVELLLVPAFLALFILAAVAAHDVDTSKTLAQSTRSDLFRLIFNVNQAAVDSAQVWLAEHQGKVSVTEDELFDEMLDTVRGRLRGLEANHKARHNPPPPAETF